MSEPLDQDAFNDFALKLRHHDWFHAYSDDARVFNRGEQQRKDIDRLARTFPADLVRRLWAELAPAQFKCPV